MSKKYQKLILSLILDGIGFIPFPLFDYAWAPISGYIMTKMYKGKKGKIAALVNFVEEILIFDVIPTFTIMWFYSYIIQKRKTTHTIKN
ncbi:MAG: hypothetical protein ACWIPJ_11115 [Polaribacter sp.]